ncbi:hypothetical protein PGT21_010840 [Puccinia graminis f. sp. tritici]|uniref:Uncharacterized protein n=1 Tax=Puccinia graminis f. sp. tritici TaxID=56615 RepID=A0A5B0R073_PUCGR|nr:hypothetical protein PGT21_010840 [Puccinia graminis f. sp. tritici]
MKLAILHIKCGFLLILKCKVTQELHERLDLNLEPCEMDDNCHNHFRQLSSIKKEPLESHFNHQLFTPKSRLQKFDLDLNEAPPESKNQENSGSKAFPDSYPESTKEDIISTPQIPENSLNLKQKIPSSTSTPYSHSKLHYSRFKAKENQIARKKVTYMQPGPSFSGRNWELIDKSKNSNLIPYLGNSDKIYSQKRVEFLSLPPSNNRVSPQEAIDKKFPSEGFCFDKEFFFCLSPSLLRRYNNKRIMKLVESLSQEGKISVGKLVVTESQLIPSHSRFTHNQKGSIESNLDNPDEYQKEKGNHLFCSSREKLWDNREFWYAYWLRKPNFNPENFVETIESFKFIPMRKAILSYLFYVDMISTVLPKNQGKENDGSALEEAFKLLRLVSEPITKNSSGYQTNLFPKWELFKYKIASKGTLNNIAAVWVLVEVWMEEFRKELFDQQRNNENRINQNFKNLFNNIFYHSIEMLTTKLHAFQIFN